MKMGAPQMLSQRVVLKFDTACSQCSSEQTNFN
uniref:Uncharacterized protein n=1 Tax=Arundo donax TaxID=35708 RepID=A0A0A8Z2E0_ARUDO